MEQDKQNSDLIEELEELSEEKLSEDANTGLMGYDPEKGCTIQFFARFFNMNPQTVRSRLAHCPCVTSGRYNYYSPKYALDYLAEPKMDIDKILSTKKPHELPLNLQSEYWSMRKKRLEVETEARELWRTDVVMDSFVDIFHSIKTTVQLWPERLNREVGITAEQRELLINLLDEFQDTIVKTVKEEMGEHKKTAEIENIKSEVDDILEEAAPNSTKQKNDLAVEYGLEEDSVILDFM